MRNAQHTRNEAGRSKTLLRWALCAAVLCAVLAPVEASPVRTRRTATQTELSRHCQTGTVRLGQIPAFRATPLSLLTLEAAQNPAAGVYVGKMSFGGTWRAAILHFVADARDPDLGSWVLAIKWPMSRISGVVPGFPRAADQLEVGSAALVVSPALIRASSDSFPPLVRKFYADVVSANRYDIRFDSGINLISSATARGAAGHALRLLGLGAPRLVLQGVVLKDADPNAFKKAKRDGKLGAQLRKSTEFRATLPNIRIPGLPSHFNTGTAALIVSGKPSIGVSFGLKIRDGRHRRSVSCYLGIEGGESTKFVVVGKTEGRWERAFGIPGFNLTNVTLLLELSAPSKKKPGQKPAFGVGLRANMELGRKKIELAGKLKFTGPAVTGGLFEGRISSLGIKDLIAVCNLVARAKGHRGRPITLAGLPDFSLRNVYFRFAPEEDKHLNVRKGYAIAGELWALGRRFAKVDCAVDQRSVIPTIKVKGQIANFNLGIVALRNCFVDVLLGAVRNPRFRVSGETKFWISRKKVDVDISTRRLHFEIRDRLAGIYRSHYVFSSPSRGRPVWSLDVGFTNELTKTLERDVSRKLHAWANKAKRDFDAAARKLRWAEGEVKRLDRLINHRRAIVRQRHAKHLRNVRNAEARVRSLDGQIRAQWNKVNRNRNIALRRVNSLKGPMARAKKAWQVAVRNRKKAPWYRKADLKAVEASKWTYYQSILGSYKTAVAVLRRYNPNTDPKYLSLVAAKKTALGVLYGYRKTAGFIMKHGIDADPSIAPLLVSRHTAVGTLRASRAIVQGTGSVVTGGARVAAFAAKHNGKILMIDSGRLRAQLAAFLRGTRATLDLSVRWLGRRKNVRLSASPDDIRKGRLIQMLYSHLKAAS